MQVLGVLTQRLKYWFGSPYFLLLIPVFAFLCTALSLNGGRSHWSGFAMDDHLYLASFQDFPGLPEYSRPMLMSHLICDGDPERNMRLIDRGVFPWWGLPEGKLAFWRPLSTLSYWLDYRIWQDDSFPMHLHNILWYAVLGVLVTLLYRRLVAPIWAAGLAGLLFIVDNAHGSIVGWLCHRYALMAAAFSVALLLVHDRWRRRGWRPGAIVAPLLLIPALASGESALAVGGYLFAYALFVDRAGIKSRIASLVPYGLIAVAYLATYRALGFGVSGTAWYTDPIGDPVAFAKAVLERIPIYLTAQWLEYPGALFGLFPARFRWIVILILVYLVVAILSVLMPLIKNDVKARFWLVGMLIALVPSCAVQPQPRLLLMAGIGGMALVGQFFGALFDRPPWLPNQWDWRIAAGVLAVVWILAHVVVAPFSLEINSILKGVGGKKLEEAFASIPAEPSVEEQDLVILQMSNEFMPWYFAIMRSSRKEHIPRHMWTLSTSERTVEIERVNVHTLVLRPQRGFVASPRRSLYRSAKYPMHEGQEIRLTGMTVRVLAVDKDGWPMAAEFRFDRPLEDPSLIWLAAVKVPRYLTTKSAYMATRFVQVTPPAVGETALLEDLAEPGKQALLEKPPHIPPTVE